MDIISLILNSEFVKKYVLLPQSNNEKIYAFSVTDKEEIKKILSTKDIHFFIYGSSRGETYEFKISNEKYVFSFVDNYDNYVVTSHIMHEVSEHKSKTKLFEKILTILNNNSVDNKKVSSKILQRFSERLKKPEVLIRPQEYLGPRYNQVLEFWNKIENMSEEQLMVVSERYDAFRSENRSEWHKAVNSANRASDEIVNYDYVYEAGWAAYDVTYKKCWVTYWATKEFIGNVENPVFLKMFDNL